MLVLTSSEHLMIHYHEQVFFFIRFIQWQYIYIYIYIYVHIVANLLNIKIHEEIKKVFFHPLRQIMISVIL